MKRSNLVLVALVAGVVSLGFANDSAVQADQKKEPSTTQPKEVAKAKYTCPMHPQVVSEKSGKCPTCGMDLVKKKAKPSRKQKAMYICPMHPEVTSDKPSECPKCGMDLEKK
ncbi:MAG: heavy metal-binding domain-containing protein [Bacteroidota bacterium]